MNNFDRTASWLAACGKDVSPENLSVQIGVDLEEAVEFLQCLVIKNDPAMTDLLLDTADTLHQIGALLKRRQSVALIPEDKRVAALDALCDREVTGNGVAFLAGFDKSGADAAVLDSNDSKLEDGKPVILEGGKIGKGRHYRAPDLTNFV